MELSYLTGKKKGILSLGLCLQFFTGCTMAQKSDQVTLKFSAPTESFHSYAVSQTSFSRRIDDNILVRHVPALTVVSHTYKKISADSEGTRVSTRPVLIDYVVQDLESMDPQQKETVELQKSMLAIRESSPDFLIDSAGNFNRFEITDQYKQNIKILMQHLLAGYKKQTANIPRFKQLIVSIEKRLQECNKGNETIS